MEKPVRLDKFLADAGAGTRSEVKKYIQKGQVQVNGKSVKKPELKVTEEDQVVMNGQELHAAPELYTIFLTSRQAVSAQRRTSEIKRFSTTLKRKTEERVFFRWDAWIKIQKAFF